MIPIPAPGMFPPVYREPERRAWRGWQWLKRVLDPSIERRLDAAEFERIVRMQNLGQRFFDLSLEMERHTRGQDFLQAMRSFPSEKFHEWCELAKMIEEMNKP